VLDAGEAGDGTPAHPLSRRIRRDEIGMLRLELFELVEQPVELFVGDLGRVVDVVLLFVVPNQRAQPVDAREECRGLRDGPLPIA
jgi:hypothetical protein